GTDRRTIIVTTPTPTASILGASVTGPEGTAVTLTAAMSDPGADDLRAGLAVQWAVTRDGSLFATGEGADFAFTPDDNGTYTVKLTVTDKDGGVATDTRTVTVTNANPAASIQGAPTSAPEGAAISLSA